MMVGQQEEHPGCKNITPAFPEVLLQEVFGGSA